MSEWPFWASLGLKGNFLTVLAVWMLLIRILILGQHVNNWSWRSTLSSWDPTMSFLSPCVNGAGGRVRKQELCLVAVAADARKSPARVTACRHWSREQLWGWLWKMKLPNPAELQLDRISPPAAPGLTLLENLGARPGWHSGTMSAGSSNVGSDGCRLILVPASGSRMWELPWQLWLQPITEAPNKKKQVLENLQSGFE